MMKIREIHKEKTFYAVSAGDGVYEIDGELLRRYGMQEGMECDGDTLLELHQKSRFRRAYRRACYLLDERDYSYSMMYQKLMRTYQDRELCNSVMQQLVQCGSINDRRYAERLAEYLVVSKRYGIFRARQEMLRRGLEKNLVEDALDGWEDAAEENIPAVLEKKYARYLTDPKDWKAREKVVAGMARLGYNYRDVKAAIEEYFADWDEDEDEE
ncbi:MAG: regulatory protein RecX [Oscillospiraceae bacterium]|nr:regulatory protein RecX [Oscillospiraceae bacterium]